MNATGFETRMIHAGEPLPRIGGAASLPVFQSSVFEMPEGEGDVTYPRYNNLPNQEAVAAKLASLEEGEAAVVVASGMAAAAGTLLALLGEGSHLLVQDGGYGGLYGLLRDLEGLGIAHDVITGDDPAAWRKLLRPATRAIYVETMTNPLLRVADHRAVVTFAREFGLASVIDNTLGTPFNFRPLPFGYDFSLHSATKYLNGHSDLVAGAVAGSHAGIERVRQKLKHFGACLDPHACSLLHRGMKTLSIRVERQNANGHAVARHLEGHPAVARVHYAGLESSPDHDRARELFRGCGGLLAFEPKGGTEAAQRVAARTRLFLCGPSLGGIESLITRPVTTSHRGLSEAERRRMGITDALVRLSVGIESVEDLCLDLDQALAS